MNGEQLQSWLTELNESWRNCNAKADEWKKLLNNVAPNTHVLINYMRSNFDDLKLMQPILAQILSLYYKLGIARCFVLQLVPTIVLLYLISISKKWRNCAEMLEFFFIAVYNEEILAGGPGSISMDKLVEEVRIPSIKFQSVYHDPTKLFFIPEFNSLKYNNSFACVQNTVRIGPYPAVERIIAENRYIVLTRVIKAVNNLLSYMSENIVCRYLCISIMTICQNGFSFSDTDLSQRILGKDASNEVFGDFAKKPRIQLSPHFLIEFLNGVNFALFNGHAKIALRALEAVHQRAHYEMFPDVLLQTNALRISLFDSQTRGMLIDSERIH